MAIEASFSHVMHHPLGVFALLVGISAAVPPLIRRVGLPDLVGLLLAGVLIGPHALQWVETDSETVRLLSDLGAVYPLCNGPETTWSSIWSNAVFHLAP